MAFVLPAFNLKADVYTGGVNSHVYRATIDCNLVMSRRHAQTFGAGQATEGLNGFTCSILVPALTDLRDASCMVIPDLVECPQGSGRFYMVVAVDDIGKGFPNEHRYATLAKIYGYAGNGYGLTLPWPTPIP